MRIGIHNSPGSFSDRWIAYCENKKISYKIVDCYRSDIISQLSDCDALMWHFNHKGPKDTKFAKQLLFSVQVAGKKVFPDFNTAWHFDDKIAQKYLLESVGAGMPESFVFYEKKTALRWAASADFPKVFKLRNGAGSDNVKLVRSAFEANKLIHKSFGKGFRQYNGWANLQERFRKYQLGKTGLKDILKGIIRLFYPTEFSRVAGREKGYVYFQEFIPGNAYDIRVVVIGNKAFAIKRLVRKDDFRASGSGQIIYGRDICDEKTLKIAFKISEILNVQCLAYDFVFRQGTPLIVEISFGFSKEGYDPCPGYWDIDLEWHEGKFDHCAWMVDILFDSPD